jgi:hypothetical protein
MNTMIVLSSLDQTKKKRRKKMEDVGRG